jgi:hypothetical protein
MTIQVNHGMRNVEAFCVDIYEYRIVTIKDRDVTRSFVAISKLSLSEKTNAAMGRSPPRQDELVPAVLET